MTGLMKMIKELVGIKSKEEYNREKEMDYRMKLARARRETETIRKNMLRQKMQAIEYEKKGEHDKAVALALQSQNKQKTLATAEMQMQKCANIHDMAETQKSMTAIMETCRDLSNGIVELADMEGAMQIQAENEEALARLIDTGEQMEMYAEGINGDMMPEVRSDAGEEALAAILAEQDQTVQHKVSLPEIRPVKATEEEKNQEDEWMKSRREDLQHLAVEG